jgi:hypothetical protein
MVTAVGGLLAMLAGLLRDLAQLAASPSGLTALAGTVLAGAMLAAVLVLLTSVACPSPDPARLGAAGEVLARGVPAPARSRRGGPVQAQSTQRRPRRPPARADPS